MHLGQEKYKQEERLAEGNSLIMILTLYILNAADRVTILQQTPLHALNIYKLKVQNNASNNNYKYHATKSWLT